VKPSARLSCSTGLLIYVGGVIASALAWDFWSFALFRLVTGLGIGGE
jgi:predicted MFS family arabinose efflux permease